MMTKIRIVMAGILLAAVAGGCQELVHMGQISDRENSFAVNDVKIEQLQPDGSWKQLGVTDGNGKWWIIKEKLKGGGRIRLSKPGYYTTVMGDTEFLQQFNIVMTPSESRPGFGESTAPAETRSLP